ncbi:MAG TPA: hypothetical protein VFT74_02810 [Isosphaeraceae bacterium]|nr:hypothetical protein [Isosphaeraceae bacterium]
MAFLAINEGLNKLGEAGLPATFTFDLSTKTTAEIGATATFAGGFGKATGTGYAAKTQARPAPSSGVFTCTQMEWKTETATDWPAAVKSVVLRNGETNLVCAWDLEASRAMNAKSTVLKFTPTITL